VPRRRLIKLAALGCALAAPFASSAGAALVQTNGIVLHAGGSYQPQQLPRHRFAPIEFQGRLRIAAEHGGPPPVLNQAVLEFDHDGRLSAGGLPVCQPAQVENATTAEARAVCKGAIVGSGQVEALIALPSGPVPASSPLTLFNGPPLEGNPTVILHARTTVPATQTFAIVVPIERRRGEYRYRATLELPPIAAGLGTITRIDAKIGRLFKSGGRRRSYVSAHCSDGILRVHGRFSFADGTVIRSSRSAARSRRPR
jgi:hypothetical protein